MRAKISVMLPAANPAAVRVVAGLGADTVNRPSDLDLAAIRAATVIPLDRYIESPDQLGGFVRHHELPGLVRVAASTPPRSAVPGTGPARPAGSRPADPVRYRPGALGARRNRPRIAGAVDGA
jgi:hypothetical protein